MENLKPVSTAGGNVKNGAATVEDSLMIPQQVNIELLSDPAILLLDIYPRELRTGVHTKTVHNVYSSIIHNSQKVETTHMSIDRWMDKPIVVYPDNGLLLSIMKYWFMLQCRWTSKTWAKWKKHMQRPHTYDDSIYMK